MLEHEHSWYLEDGVIQCNCGALDVASVEVTCASCDAPVMVEEDQIASLCADCESALHMFVVDVEEL